MSFNVIRSIQTCRCVQSVQQAAGQIQVQLVPGCDTQEIYWLVSDLADKGYELWGFWAKDWKCAFTPSDNPDMTFVDEWMALLVG